jgi:uncharacterized phage-associated protein
VAIPAAFNGLARNMAVGVKAVANEFLDLAEQDRSGIDPLQMQKLVYLAQGWALGLTDERLFPESIEAWEYGPVVPELYHSLNIYGASRIRGRLRVYDHTQRRIVVAKEIFDEIKAEIIKAVWEKYGSWSGSKLISLTHRLDSPWYRARHSNEYDPRISIENMREWFEQEADKASLINYP